MGCCHPQLADARAKCNFIHGAPDAHVQAPKPCNEWRRTGQCARDAACAFAHGDQPAGHGVGLTRAAASGDEQQQPPHVPGRASISGASGRAILETSSAKASGEDIDRPPSSLDFPDRASIAEAVGRAILQVSDLKASVEARLAASEGKLAGTEQLVSVLVEQKFAALQVETKALADASAEIKKFAALQIETTALVARAKEMVDALVHESASIVLAREKRIDSRMAVVRSSRGENPEEARLCSQGN